jgi:hypothetical protein
MEARLTDAANDAPELRDRVITRPAPTRPEPTGSMPVRTDAVRAGPARLVAARPAPARPLPPARTVARPDSRPMRAILGFTALAAASAIAAAIVRPPAGGAGATVTVVQPVDQTAAPVRHVTKYVRLQPGQTAPPHSIVQPTPRATPRVVIVTTHQSGKP